MKQDTSLRYGVILKKLTFILTFCFLTACGYHLRGDIELPQGMENIYMEAASGTLQQQMQKTLKSSKGKLVNSADEAGIILKFTQEEMSSRITSINTVGRANQFQLIYQLVFSIYDPSGKVILADQNVNVKREYFNDQTDVLGKSNEETLIRAEMYQQAVGSIMGRVNLAMETKAKAK